MKVYRNLPTKIASKSLVLNRKSKVRKGILSLPPELLLNILSHLPLWHHNRLRGVCRFLKTLTDANVIHVVKKHLAIETPNLYEIGVQQGIDQLTWAFRSAGLGSFHEGAMLSLLRQNYHNPFSPNPEHMHEYVYSFFEHIMGTLDPNTFRFGFLITWLAFFKKIEFAEEMFFQKTPKTGMIQVVYRLPRSWLGILHSTYPCPRSFQFPEDGAFLLVFMTHILITSTTKRNKKEIVSTDDKLYFYGNTATGNTSSQFKFTIKGDTTTLNEIDECINQQIWTLRGANDSDYNFSVFVEILSNYASKMGCSSHHVLEI